MKAPIKFLLLPCLFFIASLPAIAEVELHRESLVLPTYELGSDEINPLFRDYRLPGFRVSRGSRSCYPYTLQDKFRNRAVDREYEALVLENEYIRVTVLPELRGRVQGAVDKRNGWDFLYFNHVIKPADISVRQGWIAGGLEPNHPGGHGYTQFTRISHTTRNEPDGGKTIIIAEIEPVRMMKWEYEITLRPGKLYLETTGRLIGIEPFPIPFASSQNAAMHATPGLEVIYPEGTYITGHGKRSVAPWPISDGIDYSQYSDTLRSFSVFTDGLGNFSDYYGCYSHDADIDAGTVIVADHRTVPGKKYFSWGNHPQGRTWDYLLSDEDGPYIELQSQAFWDNLGYGYAWLNPLEVKSFTIYWYPVMKTGGFRRATREAAINLRIDDNRARLAVQATETIPGATVRLLAGGREIFTRKTDLSPRAPWLHDLQLPAGTDPAELRLEVVGSTGRTIIAYQKLKDLPEPPVPPKKKSFMGDMTLDELYQHALTYYHDPFQPEAEAYLEEMLRRDPLESRAHRMLGVFAYQQGKFEKAREHLKTSLINDPLNRGYESNLYLGLVERALGHLEESKHQLTIASRHQATEAQALMHLAELAIVQKNPARAVRLLREAIAKNPVHPKPRNLLAVALRLNGDSRAAEEALADARAVDPLNFIATAETWLREGGRENTDTLHRLFDRREEDFTGTQLYLEAALFYQRLGLLDDAIRLLELARTQFADQGQSVYPLIGLHLGYARSLKGGTTGARAAYREAFAEDVPYTHPYRVDSIAAYEDALRLLGDNAVAHKQLGNLFAYLRHHEKARLHWQKAADLDPNDATTWRNLANVTWQLDHDLAGATSNLERAHALAPEDTRILLELDALYDAAGATERRLMLFEGNRSLVDQNDEVRLSYVTLLLRLERYGEVIDLMKDGYFSATEFIAQRHARFALAHLGLAEELLREGKARDAIKHIKESTEFPRHLSEDAPAYLVTARQDYLLGNAHAMLGDRAAARASYEKAITSLAEAPSEAMYYQALAYRKLGREKDARFLLYRMAGLARDTLKKSSRGEGSAVANYLIALANLGLGNPEEADRYFANARAADPDVALEAFVKSRKLGDTGY